MAVKKKVAPKRRSSKKQRKVGFKGFIITSLILVLAIWGALKFTQTRPIETNIKEQIIETVINNVKPEATLTDTTKEASRKMLTPKIDTTSQNTHNEINKPHNIDSQVVVQPATKPSISKTPLEYPKITDMGYVVTNHDGRYTFQYSPEHKQAVWVAYTLTVAEVSIKNSDRSDDFRTDFRVINNGWGSAELSDYKGSGYDRGHLVASADRNDTKQENSATFVLSNISPQTKNLNRFAWNALETEVRKLAKKYEIIYITTAGVLNNPNQKPIKTIGNGVTVPESFYKALLIKYKGEYYAIGYLMPNKDDIDKDFRKYAVTIDSLEKVTGLDFFPSLDDETENRIEAKIAPKIW